MDKQIFLLYHMMLEKSLNAEKTKSPRRSGGFLIYRTGLLSGLILEG